MTIDTSGILAHIDPQRLLDTATALVAVPSPTRDAGAAADCLAAILAADGFEVERPVADWPKLRPWRCAIEEAKGAACCSLTATSTQCICPLMHLGWSMAIFVVRGLPI